MVFEQLRQDRGAFIAGLSSLLDRPEPDSDRVVNATEGANRVMGWRIGDRLLRHGLEQPRMTALPEYVVGRGLHEVVGLRQDRTPYRQRRRIVRVVRYLDRFLPRPAESERADAEADFADTFDAFYGDDNDRLSRDLALDLGRFCYRGYALPETT